MILKIYKRKTQKIINKISLKKNYFMIELSFFFSQKHKTKCWQTFRRSIKVLKAIVSDNCTDAIKYFRKELMKGVGGGQYK